MNSKIRTAAFTIVISMFLSLSLLAQAEKNWGEPAGNFVVGIEAEQAEPLKITGHLKYQGKEKAVTQITQDTLDWVVVFISDSKEQPISYKAEDTKWWDSYPHHKEINFVETPEHRLDFNFADKKWIFHAYDPEKKEILTDVPQQSSLPAGVYKVQFEFKGIEALFPATAGKTSDLPRSGFYTLKVN